MKPFHLLILICIFSTTSFAQTGTVTLEAKTVLFPQTINKEVEKWNLAQPVYNSLTKDGKELYYWTNYSRLNPTRFWDSVVLPVLNAFPQLNGSYSQSLKTDFLARKSLPMFKLNQTLLQTAQAHAEDISKNLGKPSHNSTDGRTFGDRFKNAGLINCGGENISFGDPKIPFLLVLLYLDYNLPGLGHRKSLLNEDFIEIGIGTAFLNVNQIFLVQDFACNQSQ